MLKSLMIVGGVLVAMATGMGTLEILLYRVRHRYEGDIFRYTARRLKRRLISALILAIIGMMILVGALHSEMFADPRVLNFFIFSSFVLVVGFAVCAILDVVETYKGIRSRYSNILRRQMESRRPPGRGKSD